MLALVPGALFRQDDKRFVKVDLRINLIRTPHGFTPQQ